LGFGPNPNPKYGSSALVTEREFSINSADTNLSFGIQISMNLRGIDSRSAEIRSDSKVTRFIIFLNRIK
jgi:hypothetical protein